MQDRSDHARQQDDLFKPLPLEERLEHPSKRSLRPAAPLLPYQKGQLYGTVPPPAPSETAPRSSTKLPPYLSMRPSLAPQPPAAPPGTRRIASTFPDSSQRTPAPYADASRFQSEQSSQAYTPVQEPLYSASPKHRSRSARHYEPQAARLESASPAPSTSYPLMQNSTPYAVSDVQGPVFDREYLQGTAVRPSETAAYHPYPSFDPGMVDEVAAFFNDAPPQLPPLDFSQFENGMPNAADDNLYSPIDRYEDESLPESAELSPDFAAYDPPYGCPESSASYPSATDPSAPSYQSFDPYAADSIHAAPEVYTPQGPNPAYVPLAAQSQQSHSEKHSAAPKPSEQRAGRPSAQSSPAPQKPPVKPARVLALIVAAGLLLFCGIQGGQIIFRLLSSENTDHPYTDGWNEDLLRNAHKVDLPPVGVTFSPTATPQSITTPSPSPVISLRDAAADSLNGRNSSDVQETPAPTSTPSVRTRLTAYPDNPLRNIMPDVQDLYKEYPELIGRLVIPGVLDQVVMQRNNTFYLTHNYRGSVAKGGAVFLDESCTIRNPPENLLLRGQGNVEGKSFATLWLYQTGGQAFVSTATNASLTTLYEEAQYTLIAVIVTASDPADPNYFNFAGYPTFSTDKAMLQYVENARARSLYQFSATVEAGDRLLTLATVSDGAVGQCIVLLFRMLRPEERSR